MPFHGRHAVAFRAKLYDSAPSSANKMVLQEKEYGQPGATEWCLDYIWAETEELDGSRKAGKADREVKRGEEAEETERAGGKNQGLDEA